MQLKANIHPENLTAVDGRLFFTDGSSLSRPSLWKSDGSPEGTILVKDIFPSTDGWRIYNLRNVDGTLFFMMITFNEVSNGRELWKSDGTTAGTVLVKSLEPLGLFEPEYLDVSNGLFYFKERARLWRSDGTAQGTFKLSDISFGNIFSNQHSIDVNGKLFFMSGPDLWKTDGTPPGTIKVRTLDQQSIWLEMANLNGSLLYSITIDTRVFGEPCDPGPPPSCTYISGTITTEIWKTDETGTVLLKTFDAGISPFEINKAAAHLLTAVNGTLFFIFKNQLWKTDGSPEGTMAIGSSNFPLVSDLTNAGGTLFFKNGTSQIWKSDGTTEGTIRLADVTDTSDVGRLVAVNENVFFNASSAIEGDFEIWAAGKAERPSTNDSVIGHPTVTVHLESGPSHGALAFMPDGSFSYVPGKGFLGDDRFTYSLSGGGVTSNIATVYDSRIR
ncbi:Ig-like domain-containing protein [bacterium]|nr:Ig-like domain-containing protein [bacterium]